MVSIFDQLDRLGNEQPHKLLYSYLDLNGNQIEGYTYSVFLERTKAIASHLLRNGHSSLPETGCCWRTRRAWR